ncbi:putative ABC transporter ATP-binding protein YknY [Dyella sp. AD56]|uniref:ABC transporter ATP-binding protein n=1 Tax=Dyella sp. AD56 TaxID=1528744 RepID=UPI000C825379|nr:ABC transporter ATP-binding protein [Dyella sp. AD56]PMQ05193.1 putative ABC transporter ATP-binding protein YknY [Dyella sp. AD56]
MTSPLIQVEHVSKVFLTDEVETHALSDISFNIHQGEFVCIAGPSGCGKSTLLSILGLLDTPTKGSYTLNGRTMTGLSPAERTRVRGSQIGFVFQSFNLIAEMTVKENVELPLQYARVTAAERHTRVNEVLEAVGMAHRANHYPSQLSGGQQQRVAVARALVSRPAIFLADEPTGNLDSTHGHAVMELLQRLHGNGSTICMVSHDERFTELGDRIIRLRDGQQVGASVPDLKIA